MFGGEQSFNLVREPKGMAPGRAGKLNSFNLLVSSLR
jgi:hypothetical protein